MIRIDMLRQDTRHPDKRRRHQGRASCEIAGHRFKTEGPAPIYKLATLLWLRGHGGADFEAWDDVSPFGKPGGLAMRGRVRNWARLVKGKLGFNRQAQSEEDFTPEERTAIAQAAGTVNRAAVDQDQEPDGHLRPDKRSLRDRRSWQGVGLRGNHRFFGDQI